MHVHIMLHLLETHGVRLRLMIMDFMLEVEVIGDIVVQTAQPRKVKVKLCK